MRTVLLSWTLGLVGLIPLAGCGMLGERLGATKPSPAPVTPTYESYAAGTRGSTDRVEAPNLPSAREAPWPRVPIITNASPPDAALPPRKIALTAEEKIESTGVALVPEIAKKIELCDEPPAIPAVKPVPAEETNATVGGFKSVVGQVQEFRKTWRLRYAPPDQEDPYGGSVVLEGAGLDRLRDGQQVRVHGALIPPTDRNSPARYRVQTMEIVE
jgi:hypothetical protein